MTTRRGKILRIYENVGVFENLDTGNCLITTQLKEGGSRARDLQACDRTQLAGLTGSSQVFKFNLIFYLLCLFKKRGIT